MKIKQIFTTLIYLFVGITTFAQIPTDGLQLFYPFNGNTNDLSGNNRNGTNNGATLTTDRFGQANSAYYFNGTSSYINSNYVFSPTIASSYTISFWFKTETITDSKPVLSKINYEYTYLVNPDESITTIQWNGTTSVNLYNQSQIPNSNFYKYNFGWRHYCIVYENGRYTTFLDGSASESVAAKLLENHLTKNPTLIGYGYVNSSILRYFKGSIDDIRIYNKPITNPQVFALMNECNVPKPSFADINKCYDTLTTTFNAISGYNNKWYNSYNKQIYTGNKFSTKVFKAIDKDTTYKYYVTNYSWLCESDKDTVVFNIKSLPKPNFNDIDKCYDTTSFSYSATNGYTNNWYNLNNQVINTGTTFKTKLYYNRDTTYKYLVSNYNNICESDKDTVVIKIKRLPKLSLYSQNNSANSGLLFVNSNPLTLTTYPTGGILKLNNKNFSSPIYDPKTNGLGKKDFNYSYTALNGCSNNTTYSFIVYDTVQCNGSDTLIIKPNTITGIDLPSNFGIVKIFPNPANDALNITYNNPSSSYKINIINSLSQIIYSNSLNSNTYQVSLNGFNKGLYLVQIIDINTDKVFQTSKLLIQ